MSPRRLIPIAINTKKRGSRESLVPSYRNWNMESDNNYFN